MTQFRPSRFEILPTVIKNLLIINALVYLAQNVIKSPSFSIEDVFGLHAWQSSLFKPWQPITHLFLHSTKDIFHLIGNMFGLWMFGSVLENLWGSKRFLTFYLVCGLGAAFIHLLFLSYELVPLTRDYEVLYHFHEAGGVSFANALVDFMNKHHMNAGAIGYAEMQAVVQQAPAQAEQAFKSIGVFYRENLDTSTIGASGAVFGVLAAFVYLFPNTYVYLYFLVPVKVKWMGLFYFSYELFFAIRNSAGDNVARWAHVGGAIVGLLIVITWNKTNKKTFY